MLKLALVTVIGGKGLGVALPEGGVVGLGVPVAPFHVPSPPQATKDKPLTVSASKPRVRGVFISSRGFAVAMALFIKSAA